jgi:hypothetical protein
VGKLLELVEYLQARGPEPQLNGRILRDGLFLSLPGILSLFEQTKYEDLLKRGNRPTRIGKLGLTTYGGT